MKEKQKADCVNRNVIPKQTVYRISPMKHKKKQLYSVIPIGNSSTSFQCIHTTSTSVIILNP